MRALCLLALFACGEPPLASEQLVRWTLAGATCDDLEGARVEIEAGGLGVVAHGPCQQESLLRVSVPEGERQWRAVLYDRDARAVAHGTAAGGAILVMRAHAETRGRLWLWPHLGSVTGCDTLGVARYQVDLERPWGGSERRLIACHGAGDFLLDHLWPGLWRLTLQAQSAAGQVLGEIELQKRVQPGLRSPLGDEPQRLDLHSRPGPAGAIELSYRRADGSLADCTVVGMTRLVVRARRLGSTQDQRFEIACGEELPDWSRLMAHPGRLELLAEGDQDGLIFYRGRWHLQMVPGQLPPPLIMELL